MINVIQFAIEGWVSLKRIEAFMHYEEIIPNVKNFILS